MTGCRSVERISNIHPYYIPTRLIRLRVSDTPISCQSYEKATKPFPLQRFRTLQPHFKIVTLWLCLEPSPIAILSKRHPSYFENQLSELDKIRLSFRSPTSKSIVSHIHNKYLPLTLTLGVTYRSKFRLMLTATKELSFLFDCSVLILSTR